MRGGRGGSVVRGGRGGSVVRGGRGGSVVTGGRSGNSSFWGNRRVVRVAEKPASASFVGFLSPRSVETSNVTKHRWRKGQCKKNISKNIKILLKPSASRNDLHNHMHHHSPYKLTMAAMSSLCSWPVFAVPFIELPITSE